MPLRSGHLGFFAALRGKETLALSEILHPVYPFSASHLAFLAIFLPAAVILAAALSGKFGYSRKIIVACAIVGLLCEMEKILFFVERSPYGYGYRLPAANLPLAMCPFQIFLIFALAFSAKLEDRRPLLAFMYPMLVGGGSVGMLLQYTYSHHGLLDFSTYRFFVYHAMLVFLGFYLYMSKPIRFAIKDYGMAVGIGTATLVFAVWINGFFGWDPRVNFLFVVRPPREGLPLLNLDRGWAVYIAQIYWISIAVFTLCYMRVIKRDAPAFARAVKARLSAKPAAPLSDRR